ncbi:MAG: cytochrome P450 [Alphaproteobacteria bacterium]|nr:cytochrome P450 [Alphaproteobacteria bacterium]
MRNTVHGAPPQSVVHSPAGGETFRDDRYAPPRPSRLPAIAALWRTIRQGDGDLLSLLPGEAFSMDAGELGYSRRSIKLFNDPVLVREIMLDREGVFPKSDLMVGALEPLIGDSIFVSDGPKWRRQRAMVEPAFTRLRLSAAFGSMEAAVDAAVLNLEEKASTGEEFSLDLFMSKLAADIICRTTFSVSLEADIASEVFEAFEVFEREVAQVRIWRLIIDPAWTRPRQSPAVLAACEKIRLRIGELVDRRSGREKDFFDDIARAVIDARDSATGEAFTREELIDQLGVFFLAGHETTASALTWAFFTLAQHPYSLERLRRETREVVGHRRIDFKDIKALDYAKAFFKETLRLFPPITFMPRVAMKSTRIGRFHVRRGTLVMIAPWTIHRHEKYWHDPDAFDPGRFLPPKDETLVDGAYLPFGLGPHTCVGAGFAAVESALILASIARHFDFEIIRPESVRPAARLTTRPAEQVICRVRRHISHDRVHH